MLWQISKRFILTSITSAFNYLTNFASRKAKLYDRRNNAVYDIEIAPSNYFRNLSGPEEIGIEAFEFVISKSSLDSSGLVGEPKRGMYIEDTSRDNERYTLAVIKPLYVMGNLLGFRVRNE